jgi:nicotinate-nucleotide adenylyltransferase
MIDFSRSTALFGGSFDPIHEGHLHIAKSLLELRPDIQQFVFVPAAHSPGKAPAMAPAELRLRWTKQTAEPQGFQVWEEEIKRGGESYTLDTLRAAHAAGAKREKLFLVMGGDAYLHFDHWKNPEEIRSLAQLIAVNRPGVHLPSQQPGDAILEIAEHPASSTAIRTALQSGNEAPAYLPGPVRQDLKTLFLSSQNPYARKSE